MPSSYSCIQGVVISHKLVADSSLARRGSSTWPADVMPGMLMCMSCRDLDLGSATAVPALHGVRFPNDRWILAGLKRQERPKGWALVLLCPATTWDFPEYG